MIGTDVVYWRQQIDPLIDTLDVFFQHNPGLKIYICYVERHVNTHTEFKAALARKQLALTEIGADVTKTINPHSYMYLITR